MDFSLDDLLNPNKNKDVVSSLIAGSNIKQEKLLLDAAKELQDYMIEELLNYYSSYQPSEYIRTYKILDDIRITPARSNRSEMELEIEMNSNHRSLFDGGEDGNALWLLNAGYIAEGLEDRLGVSNRLTRFEGTNFIQNAIDKFNSRNKLGIQVSVYFNESNVTGRRYKYGK